MVLRTGAEPPGVIARRFTVPAQVEGGGGSKEPTAPAAKAETMKNCERIATTGCRSRVVRRIERAYATLGLGSRSLLLLVGILLLTGTIRIVGLVALPVLFLL